MIQNIKIIIISFLVALGTVTLALNVPTQWFALSWFSPQQSYGSLSLTTLQGTDNLTNFPTTYNANNAILNAGKEDISDLQATTTLGIPTLSSLSTVGTIGTGIWHASTIQVPYGGTGSTTLSQYQVLLGNGTGNVTVPVGWGTSGQFLTSNGGGVLPSWTSNTLNTALNFVWTGTNDFTGNTYIKNLFASSTVSNPLTLNTVSYAFPSTQGAANTVLKNDGSGNVSWAAPQASTPASGIAYVAVAYSSSGTSTIASYTIPANTLAANRTVHIQSWWTNTGSANQCNSGENIGNGLATTSIGYATSNNTITTMGIDSTVLATSTTAGQSIGYSTSGGSMSKYVNLLTTGYTGVSFDASTGNNGNICTLVGYSVTVSSN